MYEVRIYSRSRQSMNTYLGRKTKNARLHCPEKCRSSDTLPRAALFHPVTATCYNQSPPPFHRAAVSCIRVCKLHHRRPAAREVSSTHVVQGENLNSRFECCNSRVPTVLHGLRQIHRRTFGSVSGEWSTTNGAQSTLPTNTRNRIHNTSTGETTR